MSLSTGGIRNARTILVVDDEPLVLLDTVESLEELGYRALAARSGDEALALLAGGQPVDLVLTDQSMPRMDGAMLARTIRQNHPSMPIVMATGYDRLPPDMPAGVRQLGKPYSLSSLAQALLDMLGVQEPPSKDRR